MKFIKKRDGNVVAFDTEKIVKAVNKAFKAGKKIDACEGLAEKITDQVVKAIERDCGDKKVPTVEMVQDYVERILMKNDLLEVAKSYILYRDLRAKSRATKNVIVDIEKTINEYLSRQDWRVNANANQGYSLGGLILNTSGKVTANYWLSHIYPEEVAEAHRSGDFHIHDLDMLSGYCAGWSLRKLLKEGFNGVPNKVDCDPPRNLSAAIGQMVNFLGTLQNEWAGAQAFSSFDTYLAPYVRKIEEKIEAELEEVEKKLIEETLKQTNFENENAEMRAKTLNVMSDNDKRKYIEKKTCDEVKQCMQMFVFNLNVPSRWGTQCVDEETECLTENGWKRHDHIKDDERILTFNYKNNTYEYLKPLKITAYDFDGKMYVLKNRTQEQWITPKHKVVRKKFNSKETYVLEEIEKVVNLKTPVIIPNSWETDSKKEIDDNLVRLLAWVVAEGNFDRSENRVRISLFQSTKNKKNIEEMKDIFKKLNITYQTLEKESGFNKDNKKCYRFRLNKEGSETVLKWCSKKKVPDIIKTLSLRQIQLFLHTYVKGDGHKESSGRMRIYTADKENLNRLQELCVLAGYGSTIAQRENGVYVLNIIRNKETHIESIVQKKYKGKVWCPTTRNGTFVARRNGKTFITGNTPFTNITLDWTCPEDMKNESAEIGGEIQPYSYGDCQKEMDIINKVFIEVMMKGDAKGRVFTFPIPTYNITKEFNWDDPNCELLFEMTAKYGMPYFQNFINSELKPNMVRSMCCRLQLDVRELLMRGNGLFGSAEMTGSIGVVTINAARLGYLYKGDMASLTEKLGYLMDLAKESLEIKRKIIQQNMDAGLFPYTKRYLGNLNNHFSTIGINGVNECIRNFTGDECKISDTKGMEIAKQILDCMRERLKNYQEETGHLYNLEATPAEGTTYRFAKEDQKRFSDILQAGWKTAPYYTNSSQLPVDHTVDAFEALTLQDPLQTKYTGGTVLHLYMGERISNATACKKLVKKTLENFKLPYITITPTFSICPKHGYLRGEHEYCPICDEEIGYREAEGVESEGKKLLLNAYGNFVENKMVKSQSKEHFAGI
ncbi:ribonucleoside triphosphate reductase [Candidatus Peregrinibacteria bacterium]|nr:ribonucleoside triphosphate reductase [Candidatus Peregrinibacteria bacterium]